MTYHEEFRTVELVRNSCSATACVDAFSLALIKTERQIRRLFTNVVFQAESFSKDDIENLRIILAECRQVYFDSFEVGLKCLAGIDVQDLVGDEYERLRKSLRESKKVRDKVFHGQLTKKGRNQDDLDKLIDDLSSWCEKFANGSMERIGYDGMKRGSYRKNNNSMSYDFVIKLENTGDYKAFLKNHMIRNNGKIGASHTNQCGHIEK